MMPASPLQLRIDQLPSLDDYQERRICADLYRRSLIGPPFYLLSFLGIWLTGDLNRWMSYLMMISSGVLGISYMRRVASKPPVTDPDIEKLRRWRKIAWLRIYLNLLGWSIVIGLVGFEQGRPTLAVIVTLTCAVSFTASGVATYAPPARQREIMLLLHLLPFVCVWVWIHELRVLTWVFFLYWISATMLAKRFGEEYESHIRLEYELLQRQAELERLARTDALTQMWNRSEYNVVFGRSWQQARRTGAQLSLLVIDVDRFKKINDTYGHLTGDACLKHVAALMRSHFQRSTDFCARIGGEEFVILMPLTALDEAARIAEAFRILVERSPCRHNDHIIPLTISVGAGEFHNNHDPSPDAMFARVDAACYSAKLAGRNRLEIAVQTTKPL